MKRSMEIRNEAVRYFEMGYGKEAVASALGLSCQTAEKWLYTCRALGKEALFVTKHQEYDHETKVRAASAVVDGRMKKIDAMREFGIKSLSALDRWCRAYREGGPGALLPKPKGRPKKPGADFPSREEELEARVRELELEVEILKRLNALAGEIEQGWRTR